MKALLYTACACIVAGGLYALTKVTREKYEDNVESANSTLKHIARLKHTAHEQAMGMVSEHEYNEKFDAEIIGRIDLMFAPEIQEIKHSLKKGKYIDVAAVHERIYLKLKEFGNQVPLIISRHFKVK